MKQYQQDFISFLIKTEALKFGDFTLKSGRKSPYFFNSGSFNSGDSLTTLARFYAEHIVSQVPERCVSIFGPAYKGIPLAVSTAMVLADKFSYPVGYTFNRKEVKEHGDRGELVGRALNVGESIIIVEDVITAGTTLREVVPQLRDRYGVKIAAVCIALDRCERGAQGESSAKDEATKELGLTILPLVTSYQIIEYLEQNQGVSQAQYVPAMKEYLKQYGVVA
jgi:orotate phosphoribosyltransferase